MNRADPTPTLLQSSNGIQLGAAALTTTHGIIILLHGGQNARLKLVARRFNLSPNIGKGIHGVFDVTVVDGGLKEKKVRET
jgi:hypothetical protein